ncbi:MAG: ABC transporter substrate-binding protein [Acetobacteraceae bacterium]
MTFTRRALIGSALAAPAIVRAQGVTTIDFLFPVAVGGPITKIIDGYAQAFQRENPDVVVRPIYAGSYTDTLTKAQTALKGGEAPAMAVLLSTDVYTLIDEQLVLPIDQAGDNAAWLGQFYPAFLRNGQIAGHTWGVPFQRSTIVLYYNKDAFTAAGLDPQTPPGTWAEHAAAAQKLSIKDQRWGVAIPGSGGFAYWMFQALAAQTGGLLANADGTAVSFDTKEARRALTYWLELQKSGATPPGVVEWGTTPRDFLEQRAAMVWTTTGNLSNIRTNAKFPFGVAMLPADRRRGTPTGGGNFYLFKAASPAQRAASLRFLQWITSAERAAQWGIDTGYVATRPDAWETPAMKAYVAGFPAAAVARDQLQYAVPELSTHDNQRVTQVLNDGLEAALTRRKTAVAALVDAQAAATRLLRGFK